MVDVKHTLCMRAWVRACMHEFAKLDTSVFIAFDKVVFRRGR
jgi:hypothetical protein